MSDPYGDRVIQDAIEQLAQTVVSQEPTLDWQEVQKVLRATVEDLMSEPGRIEGEPPRTVGPTVVGSSLEARREPPPPGPPPDANPPA